MTRDKLVAGHISDISKDIISKDKNQLCSTVEFHPVHSRVISQTNVNTYHL